MSDNLNRSAGGFSKYDSMSIEELEAILRADAEGPERDESDVDEILYVMEVLAKKRRQNGIAGKTALEAYQQFQQHYLPKAEKEERYSAPDRKKVIWLRKLTAVAASLVLVFSLAVSANAFSFRDLWNAVAKWAEETFSFSVGVEVSEPKAEDDLEYASMQDVLLKNGRDSTIIPTWIPERYTQVEITCDKTPFQEAYLAVFSDEDSYLRVSVKTFMDSEPERVEHSDCLLEVYTHEGIDYYIFMNNELIQATWVVDSYECLISGQLDIEEMKLMIDSIEKGCIQ